MQSIVPMYLIPVVAIEVASYLQYSVVSQTTTTHGARF